MIIDSRQLVKELLADLKKEFQKFEKVVLAAVIIGEDAAGLSFLLQKQKVAQILGIKLKIYQFSADISNEELIEKIEKISQNKEIKGIIIQLPLPAKFNLVRILNGLPAEKDVDALGSCPFVLAPAAGVVKLLFEKHNIDCQNKRIVINGFGRLVGKPVYHWLKKEFPASNIFVLEKDTPNKEQVIRRTDILISGVGKANLIPADWIEQGTMVIDFGCHFQKGRICGDVAPEAADKARLFTPTPGGTGPILVTMIFRNLLTLLLL